MKARQTRQTLLVLSLFVALMGCSSCVQAHPCCKSPHAAVVVKHHPKKHHKHKKRGRKTVVVVTPPRSGHNL